MNITIEVCKDTYVTTCTPAPKVDLPECEDGWEIGNGTAVCATQAPDNLAVTGPDFNDAAAMGIAGVAIAVILVGTGLALLARRKADRS